MSTINSYVNLATFKNYLVAPGQTLATDSTDDGVIEDLLEAASRYIDDQTGRAFYPRVETRSYSVPDKAETNDARLLMLDDDLLALTTLTNGNDTAIAATEYNLLPKNYTPKFGIRLKDISSTIWEVDSNSSAEYVIDVLGYWGYHDQYAQRAWTTGSTLNESGGLNATDTTWTVVSGTNFAAGQVVKIENELMIVTSVSSNDITVAARGDNGSTAATHAQSTTVSIWQVVPEIAQATLEIARNAYSRRWGTNISGTASTTPAGVVIGPRDVSELAARTIRSLARVM